MCRIVLRDALLCAKILVTRCLTAGGQPVQASKST